MTRHDSTDRPVDPGSVGSDADERPDEILAEAAAAADDDALIDAGLPQAGKKVVTAPHRKDSLAHRLYNGEAGLNVVGWSRRIYMITAVVVLICLAAVLFRGFNFGIEFAGGNSFRVPGTSADLSTVQTAAEDAGADVASAQVVGGNSILLRTGQLSTTEEAKVVDAVADAAGVQPNEVTQQ